VTAKPNISRIGQRPTRGALTPETTTTFITLWLEPLLATQNFSNTSGSNHVDCKLVSSHLLPARKVVTNRMNRCKSDRFLVYLTSRPPSSPALVSSKPTVSPRDSVCNGFEESGALAQCEGYTDRSSGILRCRMSDAADTAQYLHYSESLGSNKMSAGTCFGITVPLWEHANNSVTSSLRCACLARPAQQGELTRIRTSMLQVTNLVLACQTSLSRPVRSWSSPCLYTFA